MPPAAFELLTEKYAPPECGADGEKAMVANKVLALVARKFPAMCKAVRENACQGFCNDQCPAGSKKQVVWLPRPPAAPQRRPGCRSPVARRPLHR